MDGLHEKFHLTALKFFEKDRGVVLPLDDPEMLKRAAERRRTGRYTLEEAALYVAIKGRAKANNILNRMLDAIARRSLAIYQPWRNEVYLTDIVRPWQDEVYGAAMDEWLDANEFKIGKIFSSLEVGVAATIAKKAELDCGTNPRIGIGKLAIKAALEIERETGRVATRDRVIQRLQGWADKGEYPDVLISSDPSKHAVIWATQKGKAKPYDIDTCGKALEVWAKTRKKLS